MQNARLLCDKRMAYVAVRRGLDAESAIRLLGQKDLNTKTGILTLQDARLLCDKRMAYAAVRGGLDAELRLDSLVRRSLNTESAIRLLGRKDSIQKWAP